MMPRIPDKELLEDLRRVYQELGMVRFTQLAYTMHGRHAHGTLTNRFGGWNLALAAAGLPTKPQGRPSSDGPRQDARSRVVADAELIADLRRVAQMFGPHRFSHNAYVALGRFKLSLVLGRFRTWNNARAQAGLPVDDARCSRDDAAEPLAARPGRLACLKCDRPFNSWNVRRNRVCEPCRAANDYAGDVVVYGKPLQTPRREVA